MNFRQIARLIGLLLLLVGLAMASSLIWSWVDRGKPAEAGAARALILSVAIIWTCAVSLLVLGGRADQGPLYRKEAMAVVGLGWLACGLVGALPFYFAAIFPSAADAFFESFSGFTTTGATVVEDLARVPRSILFWRSLTHWLGGMGIVVLFVAVLAAVGGAGGKFLVASEVTGPTAEATRPRIRQTAISLWLIYMVLSAVELVLLKLLGMGIFDALCHTFGTMATGGFSTRNGSIADYRHLGVSIELVILLFMFLAGVNFNLFYQLLRGKWRSVVSNTELRVYVALLVLAAVCIWVDLKRRQASPPAADFQNVAIMTTTSSANSGLDAAFQSVAIMTTTGYGTADFDTWPNFSKVILVLLMFVGGCAGSTGGGIKVVRIIMLFKVFLLDIERSFRPKVVRPLRVGDAVIEAEVEHETVVYCALVFLTFILGFLVVTLLEPELDLVSCGAAVAATLNNIGPGLGRIGSSQTYAFLQPVTKCLLCLLMLLGRLEVYAILVLLVPRYWRSG